VQPTTSSLDPRPLSVAPSDSPGGANAARLADAVATRGTQRPARATEHVCNRITAHGTVGRERLPTVIPNGAIN